MKIEAASLAYTPADSVSMLVLTYPQEGMMAFVKDSLGDADLVLMMTDVFEHPKDFPDQGVFEGLRNTSRYALVSNCLD